MHNTPLSSRKHVVIYGNTNAGKSALFNAVLGQSAAIVSDEKGTTTDPVIKAMELIPFGPIALVDTAGLDDISNIGNLRVKRTVQMLSRTDLAIYAIDPDNFDIDNMNKSIERFNHRHIPYLLVFTKIDLLNEQDINKLKQQYPNALFISSHIKETIDSLKVEINKQLSNISDDDDSQLAGLIPKGSNIIMCVPCDSEAPKGRLILPQVQLIRDCLDNGMTCSVARDTELSNCINNSRKIDLVVTDSQAFKTVSKIVPDIIPLTSFSMLLANQRGDVNIMSDGAKAIDNLKPGDKILMAEACTHNSTHEDIGRVKIPRLIKKRTGIDFEYEFSIAHDFPEDLSPYAMVIHCGGCMITRREIQNRIAFCMEAGIPITNYGVLLAYLNGILDRCSQIFRIKSKQD